MPRPVPTSFPVAVLLCGLVAFGPISTDLYLASLPDMARLFATDAAMVQWTLSGFLIGFAVMQLVYGPLSDRFGRRPVLLAGIAIYLAATVLCMLAPSVEVLIGGRVLQAVGACCGPVVGRAVVRDVYPRDQAARVMSYMASAMALAPFAAPVAGGWLHARFGWQSNFALLGLFALLLLAGVRSWLAETHTHPDRGALAPARLLANYGTLLRNRSYLATVLTVGVCFGGMFTFISGSSFVLIDVMGLPPQYFGFGFAAVIIGYISGGLLAGRLTHRLGLERMIRLGVLGCAASGAAAAALAWAGVVSLPAVLLPFTAYFLCAALVLPNGTAAAIAPFPRMAGVASAGVGFVQMVGGAAAGWLTAHLFDGSGRPMASILCLMGLAAAALYLWLTVRKDC